VAIKYSVPREMYARLTRLAGDRLIVSTASEEEWLDNIIELGWQLYLCSSPPYLYQTSTDRRMRDYTDLAFKGDHARARRCADSLNPVREAFKRSVRRRNSTLIRNTGKNCSDRQAPMSAVPCSS